MLRIDHLSKTYPSGEQALDEVSFSIDGNDIVALIGPSGAGKTTLVRCINRLTEPTAGEIWLNDRELTGLNKRELKKARRDIGMVFQEYSLVERLTVMENVLSGRLGYTSTWRAFRRKFHGDDIERAYELLDRVGLDGHENDRADELSGGQRQRVGIARAIIQEPDILLADEPTSSLDPETSHAVMDLLTEIARDQHIPVLINIHEVPLAIEYADRIIGMHDGEIVFEGPPEELTESEQDRIYRGEDPGAKPDDTTTTDSDGVMDSAEVLK